MLPAVGGAAQTEMHGGREFERALAAGRDERRVWRAGARKARCNRLSGRARRRQGEIAGEQRVRR
jgi:hypothetical protein